MRTLKVIETEDGSSSIYIPELNETYHSFHGAITESKHVFIEKGLEFYFNNQKKENIKILEVGMGTGLNALLSCQFANTENQRVSYTTLEPFPIPKEIINQLNFQSIINVEEDQHIYNIIHDSEWSKQITLGPNFEFLKLEDKLEDCQIRAQADIVYFDAFAPNKQAELWTLEALQKVKNLMSQGSILVTYCAQGQFKRNLKSLGFQVESLQGPPGKMEMVRASLN